MKLYVDYCPKCPCPSIDKDGRRYNGHPDPTECRHCTRADTLKDQAWGHVEAEQEWEKLRDKIAELTRGLEFYNARMSGFKMGVKCHLSDQLTVLANHRTAIVIENNDEGIKIKATRVGKA